LEVSIIPFKEQAMPLKPQGPYSRVKTLRQLIHDLQDLVKENPDVGDCMVISGHSASGVLEHLNSFHVKELEQGDLDDEFGFIYEDEGLTVGDKVIELSVGGN
jgi:hypothetical protein